MKYSLMSLVAVALVGCGAPDQSVTATWSPTPSAMEVATATPTQEPTAAPTNTPTATTEPSPTEEPCTDRDGDGFCNKFSGGEDCDDANPLVNPDAIELCDGEDRDCNGVVDDILFGECEEEPEPTEPPTPRPTPTPGDPTPLPANVVSWLDFEDMSEVPSILLIAPEETAQNYAVNSGELEVNEYLAGISMAVTDVDVQEGEAFSVEGEYTIGGPETEKVGSPLTRYDTGNYVSLTWREPMSSRSSQLCLEVRKPDASLKETFDCVGMQPAEDGVGYLFYVEVAAPWYTVYLGEKSEENAPLITTTIRGTITHASNGILVENPQSGASVDNLVVRLLNVE